MGDTDELNILLSTKILSTHTTLSETVLTIYTAKIVIINSDDIHI
jgi:hypothetical protein